MDLTICQYLKTNNNDNEQIKEFKSKLKIEFEFRYEKNYKMINLILLMTSYFDPQYRNFIISKFPD